MDIKKLISEQADKQVAELAKMERRLSKRGIELQKQLFNLIRDKFLDSMQRDQAGNLLYNTHNINRVNEMSRTFDYFREVRLRPAVTEFGKDLMSIVDIEAGYFLKLGAEFGIDFQFEKITELISKQIGITLNRTPEIIPGSYLDRLLQGTQVRDKVTNVVLEHVSAKTSFTELKQTLSTIIQGSDEVNGVMEKYLRTYAYDTFSTVQRSIDLNIADTYGMTCFVYEGNLIKDSREFCIEHLGKVICRDQFEEIQAQDWAGKNPDLPFEVALGGYNCRHTAMWIPDEAKKYLDSEQVDIDAPNKETVIDSVKDIEKLFPTDKEKLVKYINDNYQQRLEIDSKGRVYQTFMGKKMYVKGDIDNLRSKWINFERQSIVSENNRNLKEYLKEKGFNLVSQNKDATSVYYRKDGVGIVRLSDHSNLSTKYIEPLVNAYSEKKGGYLDLIKEIERLLK